LNKSTNNKSNFTIQGDHMKQRFSRTLAASLLVFSSISAQAQIGCDRACLTGFVDAWFSGLHANSVTGVPLAADARISHNGTLATLQDIFWDSADSTIYRWDLVNQRLGDTGTEAIIQNSDGSMTMIALRLKVQNGAITEIETIKANEGDAGALWGPHDLLDKPLSPFLQLSIAEASRDSYYRLIAAAESYWRAFQTNGTDAYHPADLLPDSTRFENGFQTTGLVRNGQYRDTASGFHQGAFLGRNLWDRRYPVVDEERGIVMSMVRFGLKDGMESQSTATTNSRIVAEFFTVKAGLIQEIHAVLFNVDEDLPPVWEPEYSPPRGGAGW
jgi:hypothetical protein